jgi:hypothetical protein
MEFLDINLASIFLHSIHNPFFWRILEKTKLFSGFKNPYKKHPRNKKTNHEYRFVDWKKGGRKLESENTRVNGQKP